MKELTIEAKTENLDEVLAFITSELPDAPAKVISQISLAVEEIFVNIASYAYSSKSGTAIIRIKSGARIAIEFEDYGIPYNLLAMADPDITLSADERKEGGLGVFLVKQVVDYIEYHRENGKNILTIEKNN